MAPGAVKGVKICAIDIFIMILPDVNVKKKNQKPEGGTQEQRR
jgi:hypothetical protein